jgi:cysteine desulfuration protein SufE
MDDLLFKSCLDKQEQLKQIFKACTTPEAIYQKIIEWGRNNAPLAASLKTPERIVKGCQSIVYMHATLQDGNVFFEVDSEALISSGLASLLLFIYNGQPPEVILKCPPNCITELGIHASLTPGRSNGLASMYLRMKQEALKFLMPSPSSAFTLN